MTLSPGVEGAGLHCLFNPLCELLESSPAVFSPDRERKTRPHPLLDDGKFGSPIKVLDPATPVPTSSFTDQPQPPMMSQLLEVAINSGQRSPAI